MERFLLQYLQDNAVGQAVVRAVYARLCQENTLLRVFSDASVGCPREFEQDILRPGSLPFLLYWDGEPGGLVWLNSLEGKSARGHFAFYRRLWGYKTSLEVMRRCLAYGLGLKDAHGYLFDCLIGITPVSNKLAVKLTLLAGARQIGVIPKYLWNASQRASEDAVLTCVTREILEEQGL